MITVDADGLIIAVLIFGCMCAMAGYVIGCINTAEKLEKEKK
jgi:hypothetical protein